MDSQGHRRSETSGPAQAWRRPAARIRPATALGDRLVLECARLQRQKVPFSLISIHHLLWQDDERGDRERLREHLLRNVSDLLRVSDAVYEAGLPGCHVVVLPHTSSERAHVVLERIVKQAKDDAPSDFGPVSIEPIEVGPAATDAAVVMMRITEQLRSEAHGPIDGRPPVRPRSRLPVGNLSRFEEALHTEINLAGRDGSELAVVALAAPMDEDAVPGLLACDVDDIAALTVRGCDQVFEVAPTCVAFILSRTSPDAAAMIAERILEQLHEQDPDSLNGDIQTAVLQFDREHPDAAAFLATLRDLAD